MQKTGDQAGGAIQRVRRRRHGRPALGSPGYGHTIRGDGGVRPRADCPQAPSPSHRLCRRGAPDGAPAHPGGRPALGVGCRVVPPVCGDHGGRVPGHQRGAERHFRRPVRRGQPVHGGGREAVHLPLSPGRPHHLPGQIRPLCRLPGGGGGRGAHGAAQRQLPLPARGAGGGQFPFLQRDDPGCGGDGLYPRRGPGPRPGGPAPRRAVLRGAQLCGPYRPHRRGGRQGGQGLGRGPGRGGPDRRASL